MRRARGGGAPWRPDGRNARTGGRGFGTGTERRPAQGIAVLSTARSSRARGPPCSQEAGGEGPSGVVAVLAPAGSTFRPGSGVSAQPCP